MSRILVTGAAGVVGGYVGEVFADHDLILTDIVGGLIDLDVRDADSVRKLVLDARPEIVIHLAAATDVDRCEQDPDLAHGTNTTGTRNVALACREAGPANVYGHSKLGGECVPALTTDSARTREDTAAVE